MLTKQTKTSLDYWLEIPIYEWSDWIESLTELLNENNK